MKKLDVKELLLIAVLISFAIFTQFLHDRKTRDLQHALDTLASNEILRRAGDSLRWEVRVATVTDNMAAELKSKSDSIGSLKDRTADLITSIESLEGRVATATEVNVNLASALRTDSVRIFTTVEAVVDSITAPYDDGLLSGRIGYHPPDQRFSLEYLAQVRGSLITVELPDGRWSVMAMAEDTARVNFSVPMVFVNLADPVQYCGVVTRGKWGLLGYLAGALSLFPG